MRKILLISLILISFIFASAVNAASENITLDDDVQNIEINNNDIKLSASENQSDIKTFEEIQNKINESEENSTIILNGTYTGSGNRIIINKNVTIDGLGKTILDANHKSGIFNITSNNVVLKNINFINSKSSTNGGAITSEANLSVINCNFINNTVYGGSGYNLLVGDFYDYGAWKGGAINANKDLSVVNSTFTNNSAHLLASYRSMDAYNTYDEGDAFDICCYGNLFLEKSNFTNFNYFTSNQTSPIIGDYSACSIIGYNNSIITNCNFQNQTNILKNGENVSLSNSNLKNSGGLFYIHNLNIINCTITNAFNQLIYIENDANIIINNSLFENNNAIIEINGHSKIINSTFKNNHIDDTAILNLASYDLQDNIFIDNTDATILSKKIMLNDSLDKIYLFKTVIKNKFSKVYYDSEKSLIVHVINTKSDDSYSVWGLDVYINGRHKSHFDSNAMFDFSYGSLKFSVSKWKVGKYDVDIEPENMYTKGLSFKMTVLKAPTVVKAPKVTVKFKKSSYFKVKVTHKITKKAVKNIYLKLKIDKKTFKVKTSSKGIVKFNTKNLKIGKHKVTVSSANSNYKISAKSQITVKK